LSIRFNLKPPAGDDKQTRVWNVIREKFGDGREFQKNDIEPLCGGISSGYIKKLLTEWTNLNRLERIGFNRDTRYSLAAPLREAEEEESSLASEPATEGVAG
jgi:hypothetical protein